MRCVYTTECYSAIKNKILPFGTTWMDLESIMLSEISQKDKYHMISLTNNRERKRRERGRGGGRKEGKRTREGWREG